jgi:hypothetical protein
LPVDGNTTEVVDEIEAIFKPHWFWGLLGRFMWLNMPVLFAFRQWKTKQKLEKKTLSNPVIQEKKEGFVSINEIE